MATQKKWIVPKIHMVLKVGSQEIYYLYYSTCVVLSDYV